MTESTMNFDALLDETRDALHQAVVADPTAAKELALDLSEVFLLEGSRKKGGRKRAPGAIHRVACGLSKLRGRYGDQRSGMEKSKNTDGPAPIMEDATGGVWTDETGLWMFFVDMLFEPSSEFKNGAPPSFITSFKSFLNEWREQVLRAPR
jgi:hypothetical protein